MARLHHVVCWNVVTKFTCVAVIVRKVGTIYAQLVQVSFYPEAKPEILALKYMQARSSGEHKAVPFRQSSS